MSMITIDLFNQHEKGKYDNLINYLYNFNVHDKIAVDNLILSSIGARVCYSSDPPLKMLYTDEKIINKEKRMDFLRRLYRKGHFSIFAHSPIFIEFVSDFDFNFELPYKCWYYNNSISKRNYNTYICANWRHLCEYYYIYVNDIHGKSVFSILDAEFENNISETNIKMFIKFFNGEIISTEYNIDNKWQILNELKDIDKEITPDQVAIIAFFIDHEPFLWYSFLIPNVSISFTHQCVRHTWQNFNQRSFRYTQPESVIIPPSINKDQDASTIFRNTCNRCFSTYDYLRQKGIKKEDARFIIPYGNKTLLMTSGPRFVFEDFVNKRTISHAQWEIRRIANIIAEILDLTIS